MVGLAKGASIWRLALVCIVITQVAAFMIYMLLSPRYEDAPQLSPQSDDSPAIILGDHSQIKNGEDVPAVRPPNESVVRKAVESLSVDHASGPVETHTPLQQQESPATIVEYRKHVAANNEKLVMLNGEKFGAASPTDIVVVVQVHKRVGEFQLFLQGLSAARHLESVILVVSMDYIMPELESTVWNITMCRVIPIYFPKSLQLHPNEFPGRDPSDCDPKLTKAQAVQSGCQNAKHPDTYGHYREEKITATKHHWWWKCVFVFDKIPALKAHTGLKLFLEEDHYLSPDFLHILRLMEAYNEKERKGWEFFSLGRQRKRLTKRKSQVVRFGPIATGPVNQFEAGMWRSTVYNMGFAFKKSVWETIKACSETFCSYDDYNWDWTLEHVAKACRNKPFTFVAPLGPRVFHFGMCGVHFKMNNCNPSDALREYQEFLSSSKDKLFPGTLGNVRAAPSTRMRAKPYGGWGDQRDVAMCKSFVT